MEQEITIRERWLSALAYLSLFVFIPLLATGKSPFQVRHCRQGFALFCAEVLGLLLHFIVSSTLGVIPILGALITIVLSLVLFLAFLILSALGFSKALFGESWRIPFLDEWADRLPIN